MAAPHSSGAFIERADSPLGSWISARWAPPSDSPLHAIVERIWYFEGVLSHARERVFPDGRAELIIMLDEPHRDGDTQTLERFPPVCINGLRTRPSVVVAPAGRCRVLGIRFDPLGACRLLRESMKQLVDVTIDLRDALGSRAAELASRCAAAAGTSVWNGERNAAAMLGEARAWLVENVAPIEYDPAVRWTANVIRSTNGAVTVDEIGSKLSMRRSQLSQRFNDVVGVTPKRFARIVRFHRALSLIGSGESIGAAAADLAYFDQAHLYRDFAEFASMTPGAFIAAKRYPAGVNLAEP